MILKQRGFSMGETRTRSSPPWLLPTICASVVVACAAPSVSPRSSEVTVQALDYAFQLPDTLPSGPSAFRLHNAGKVPHEMIMVLLNPGVSVSQVMAEVGAGRDPEPLAAGIVGILIAGPGETAVGALAVDLLPGRTYALICNFQDAPDKPEHVGLGMISGRTVTAAPQ
ncbi:MAG: hypothetical protein ACKVZ0_12235 [Gemmatimonadales bacterium]